MLFAFLQVAFRLGLSPVPEALCYTADIGVAKSSVCSEYLTTEVKLGGKMPYFAGSLRQECDPLEFPVAPYGATM